VLLWAQVDLRPGGAPTRGYSGPGRILLHHSNSREGALVPVEEGYMSLKSNRVLRTETKGDTRAPVPTPLVSVGIINQD
jgi:hypothetical protein